MADEEFEQQPSVGHYSVSPFIKPEVYNQIARRRTDTQQTSWHWSDTWHEEHHRAFVVAKMCKADLLEEVRQSLLKAVAEGQTYAEWKKAIIPKLENEWLDKTLGDLWKELSPEDQEKHKDKKPSKKQWNQKITSKRLETIYRTNMKVAHVAGQYQTLVAKSHLYPYWQYNTQEDDRVRNAHAALNGLVFRHDDPIWETHFPPNGWRCRCYVTCLDDDDLKEQGLTVTNSSTLNPVKEENASGEVKLTYTINGQKVKPVRGWGYNPGKIDYTDNVAKAKMKSYYPALSKLFGEDLELSKYDEPTRNIFAVVRKLMLGPEETDTLLEAVNERTERAQQRIPESKLSVEGEKIGEAIVEKYELDDSLNGTMVDTIKRIYVHNEKSKESDLSTGKINGSHNILTFLNEIKRVRNLDLDSISCRKIKEFPGVFEIIYKVINGWKYKKTVFLPNLAEEYYSRCIEVLLKISCHLKSDPECSGTSYYIGYDTKKTKWSVVFDQYGKIKTMFPVSTSNKENDLI